jgi:selenocysteine lyase/cysteine desulfurase
MLMAATDRVAALRACEFRRLDARGLAYLDYTGAALYPESLVCRDAKRLATGILGNPHSESAPSIKSTEAMECARRMTLEMLAADPATYDVIFTANATAGIRILAEAFPFADGSRLVLTADNHNSVNGLRVVAARRRASVEYVPLTPALRAHDPAAFLSPVSTPSLFAFPAQSNFSGVRHPLDWVRAAQQRVYRVLLDAAAYIPTKALSLSHVPADFVTLSFYKWFGYPTGVGALVARREALGMLRRRYFGGGTVESASVRHRVVRLRHGSARFEDGTPNFLAMPAVVDGLRWVQRVGICGIEQHVAELTRLLLARLQQLGDRAIVYGPSDTGDRGGTVAFNLVRRGRVLPFRAVEAAARDRGIAIRGGCFCNPGAAEYCLGGTVAGALRASIGIPTTIGDLDRLLEFAADMT